jgi:hypothetical protein
MMAVPNMHTKTYTAFGCTLGCTLLALSLRTCTAPQAVACCSCPTSTLTLAQLAVCRAATFVLALLAVGHRKPVHL